MAGDFDGLYKSNDGAALRFYEEAKLNQFASDKTGRPVYDECLMVEVIAPGSRESVPVFELERKFADAAIEINPALATPRRSPKYAEYEAQINAYRSGETSKDLSGTPLETWPTLSKGLVASCRHEGIFTVEALAALPDSRLPALGPGGRELVAKAKAFLAAAAGNAVTDGLAAENEHLKLDNERLSGEVKTLSEQLTALSSQVAALQGAQTTPPPPPPPPPTTRKTTKPEMPII